MAIEIVDFPIENGGSFYSYVKLPEGNHLRWSNPQDAASIGIERRLGVILDLTCCTWSEHPAWRNKRFTSNTYAIV